MWNILKGVIILIVVNARYFPEIGVHMLNGYTSNPIIQRHTMKYLIQFKLFQVLLTLKVSALQSALKAMKQG